MDLKHLDNNLIFLNNNFANQEDMFRYVSQVLIENDYVTDQYLEKVLAREQNHPTGFKLKAINVAMPHVDPEYIKKNGLFLVASKNGILFKNAETDDDLAVNLIFGLLLKESDTHLSFLMKLAGSFQNDSILQQLLNSNNKTEAIKILTTILT